MGRRKKRHPKLEGITIETIGAEGKSIARHEGKVVLIAGGIPGDVADVQVTKKKKAYLEGRITALLKPSELRQEAFCTHFGTCGGCKWQSLPYEQQLKFKQQQVVDQLTRIGHLKLPAITPILDAPATQYYRNKLEFTFSNKRWLDSVDDEVADKDMNGLGFHVPGRFDKVLQVDKCYLQDDYSNTIRRAVDAKARAEGWSFYDIRNHTGFFRNLTVRNNSKGHWMVIVAVGEDDRPTINALFEWMKGALEIHSAYVVVNEKMNDSIGDLEPELMYGEPFLEEDLDGLTFRIGPKSFFQTNTEQAKALYRLVREHAAIGPEDNVYDLYTGTGTIANYLAKSCQKITGVEYVEEAVEAAREAAIRNGIDNAQFFAGDMAKVLTKEFFDLHGAADVIVTDPPRAGMHGDVTQRLLESGAKRIVYVSCNPATQARDMAILDERYKITFVQPVDMFPQTHHVENIAVLELR